MRKLPDEGQIITSSWCICAIKILPGRPIANALGYRRLFRFCLVKVIHRSQSRAIWKKKLRHARTKIRNSAFGWHWLSMKSTRGEANKMSVLFRQNWVITQFRSCWGIFKTIVVAFGTLRPRQNLSSWRFDHWFSIEVEGPMEFWPPRGRLFFFAWKL